jgi:cell division control protein 12
VLQYIHAANIHLFNIKIPSCSISNTDHGVFLNRGAAFTIMVVGESGLGKTTFVNTLFSTTIKNYAEHKLRHKKQMDKTVGLP